MTHVDTGISPRRPLQPGRAYDAINGFFVWLQQVGGAARIDANDFTSTSDRNQLEERLRIVQETISSYSMYLPAGFAAGLNRQFANMMDEDAWEEDDEPISLCALTAFIKTLICVCPNRRPGIGTNGRGSVTASWYSDGNRLIVECLPSGRVSMILSRQMENGELERAAFDPTRPERILEILAPFGPGVWFDG